MASATYPVHVQARLDGHLSRWLWLVKWILVIPHYIVLAFLWLAFLGSSIAAFFAILFTGSYPRALFDFNVGVMRWSWRVSYYAYGALGTDRYPPFTLADVPDYPARLSVDRPQRLSRGLVLVKWWLLALPHYIVIGFFVGGGMWLADRHEHWGWSPGGGGLIAVLVLVSAVVLAATGSYPRALFDIILGLQRWVLRVAGYAALMTDVYPPFRLDLGGPDPDGTFSLGDPARPTGPAAPSGGSGAHDPAAGQALPASAQGPEGVVRSGSDPAGARRGWTGGRITSLVIGTVLALVATGSLVVGGAALWADRTLRDGDGFLTTATTTLTTDTRALVSPTMTMHLSGPDRTAVRSVLGETRLRFTPSAPDRPVFVGVASAQDAAAYLAGTSYVTVTDPVRGQVTTERHQGAAVTSPPASTDIWVASTTGTGTQTLTWTPRDGDWTIVAMNADAGPGVSVEADAGATAPILTGIAMALLLGGGLLFCLGMAGILVPVVRSGSGAGDVRPVGVVSPPGSGQTSL